MVSIKEHFEYIKYSHPKAINTLYYLFYPITYPCYRCYCFIHPPPRYYCGTAARSAHQRKCERMSAIRINHQARYTNRRSSLSLSTTQPNNLSGLISMIFGGKQMQGCDQSSSPLLSKLPPEIRLMIWEFVMDMKSIHIRMLTDPRQQHRFLRMCAAQCTTSDNTSAGHGHVQCKGRLLNADSSILALLQTCRFIYTEALPILYSGTHFNFSARTLVPFNKLTPITHIQRIRSISLEIRIDRWTTSTPEVERKYLRPTTEAIRVMNRLQKTYLYVGTTYSNARGWLQEQELLELIRASYRDVFKAMPSTCEKWIILSVGEERKLYRVDEEQESLDGVTKAKGCQSNDSRRT